MYDRTGELVAHGIGRRTAHRAKPAALADRVCWRLRYKPDRGWPGPGTAAPAASHEAERRPLVPVLLKDRPRTHPLPARPAHRSLLPIRPPSAGLIDPVAAAALAGATYRPRPSGAADGVIADRHGYERCEFARLCHRVRCRSCRLWAATGPMLCGRPPWPVAGWLSLLVDRLE